MTKAFIDGLEKGDENLFNLLQTVNRRAAKAFETYSTKASKAGGGAAFDFIAKQASAVPMLDYDQMLDLGKAWDTIDSAKKSKNPKVRKYATALETAFALRTAGKLTLEMFPPEIHGATRH